MDAPTYPPATVWVAPVAVPVSFGIDTITVKELLADPVTRQILFDAAPRMKGVAMSSQFQTHVSNYSARSLYDVKLITAEQLDAIDRAFKALPAGRQPAL